ncbi:hypothetical protein VNO78_18155 [Psophocarpus tetragonolobus]|uniref:Uncharacterized protein n=1 Tax=Psophocarpus tetragonolobus TaxID=3891 RepID=A0AAN9SIA0_PSOTE
MSPRVPMESSCLEATERVVPGGPVSPSNPQLPTMVSPSTLSDNASTQDSLHMITVVSVERVGRKDQKGKVN